MTSGIGNNREQSEDHDRRVAESEARENRQERFGEHETRRRPMPDLRELDKLDQLLQAVREFFAAEKAYIAVQWDTPGAEIETRYDRLREARRRLVELVEETK